ncbi:MAG TPA: electron transfer flavoprotein subunit alpha/FixB family protein [Planctomycetota bacterium]|nr:electron transfer flavoprotein subunit alpha/FixB family protein [Planctomycetota bacterium]
MAAMDILVYLEIHGAELKRSSREALGEARRLAAKSGGGVSAVLLGDGARAIAASLRGTTRAFVSEDPVFRAFHLAETAGAIREAQEKSEASVVLLAATSTGREAAAALAADLQTCVAADVIEVDIKDQDVTVRRPVYAGKALLTARFRRLPAVVTLRPNVFPPEEGGEAGASIEDLSEPGAGSARVTRTIEPEVVTTDLTEADIIVSGGRGMKGPENFPILESLAKALGGVVGASRAVCDAGWRPHSEQVGQTGKTVSPRLYIACGISGAIQHLAGMSSSKHIVAINKDSNAPIFQVADYGIVGDVFEVVPALVAELNKPAR